MSCNKAVNDLYSFSGTWSRSQAFGKKKYWSPSKIFEDMENYIHPKLQQITDTAKLNIKLDLHSHLPVCTGNLSECSLVFAGTNDSQYLIHKAKYSVQMKGQENVSHSQERKWSHGMHWETANTVLMSHRSFNNRNVKDRGNRWLLNFEKFWDSKDI